MQAERQNRDSQPPKSCAELPVLVLKLKKSQHLLFVRKREHVKELGKMKRIGLAAKRQRGCAPAPNWRAWADRVRLEST